MARYPIKQAAPLQLRHKAMTFKNRAFLPVMVAEHSIQRRNGNFI